MVITCRFLAGLALLSALGSCTATEQTAETAAPGRTPTAVNSDADRRAIYNSNGGYSGSTAVPDATPNRLRLGEQASGTNAQQRIETLNTNDANTSTPETRVRRLKYDGDTLAQP